MSNIAIFASGGGTNAEAIINFFENNPKKGCVKALLSNNDKAYALVRAANHNIPTLTFSGRELRETPQRILSFLAQNEVDFIVLAGYMLLVPSSITSKFENRIVNIHPALLPAFGGKGMYGDNVHRAVIAEGAQKSGITIHLVNEKYDDGDIVFQASIDIQEGETAETLAQKIHHLEHRHYPEVIATLLNKEQ